MYARELKPGDMLLMRTATHAAGRVCLVISTRALDEFMMFTVLMPDNGLVELAMRLGSQVESYYRILRKSSR